MSHHYAHLVHSALEKDISRLHKPFRIFKRKQK